MQCFVYNVPQEFAVQRGQMSNAKILQGANTKPRAPPFSRISPVLNYGRLWKIWAQRLSNGQMVLANSNSVI